MFGKYLLIAAYLGFAASSLNVTSEPSADGGKLASFIACYFVVSYLAFSYHVTRQSLQSILQLLC